MLIDADNTLIRPFGANIEHQFGIGTRRPTFYWVKDPFAVAMESPILRPAPPAILKGLQHRRTPQTGYNTRLLELLRTDHSNHGR